MNKIGAISALALVVSSFSLSGAQAGAKELFTSLDGVFRGSGTGVIGSTGKKVRLSCQLTNTYDIATGKLKMSGKCASSQGSRRMNGSITHAGNKITGTYISLRSSIKMTKSSGKVGRNSLSIYSSFVDEDSGKLGKVRQTIQLTRAGFQADILNFDNKTKKYKSVGVISFRRK